CRPHSEETKVYEDVNKINQASYVRGVFMVAKLNNIPEVMTFFLLFEITISFRLSSGLLLFF
ncbi:hypothetical protein WDU94_002877, partial [Cyamophila willieti]